MPLASGAPFHDAPVPSAFLSWESITYSFAAYLKESVYPFG